MHSVWGPNNIWKKRTTSPKCFTKYKVLEESQQTIDVQNYPFAGHAGKKTYLLVQTADMFSCPVHRSPREATMEPFLLGEWWMCNHSPKRNGLKDAPRGAKMSARDPQILILGSIWDPLAPIWSPRGASMEPFLLGEWSMCNHSPKRNGLKGAPRGVKMGVVLLVA